LTEAFVKRFEFGVARYVAACITFTLHAGKGLVHRRAARLVAEACFSFGITVSIAAGHTRFGEPLALTHMHGRGFSR
jgi:hypothetical protein